jgi:hypothetical protein
MNVVAVGTSRRALVPWGVLVLIRAVVVVMTLGDHLHEIAGEVPDARELEQRDEPRHRPPAAAADEPSTLARLASGHGVDASLGR